MMISSGSVFSVLSCPAAKCTENSVNTSCTTHCPWGVPFSRGQCGSRADLLSQSQLCPDQKQDQQEWPGACLAMLAAAGVMWGFYPHRTTSRLPVKEREAKVHSRKTNRPFKCPSALRSLCQLTNGECVSAAHWALCWVLLTKNHHAKYSLIRLMLL